MSLTLYQATIPSIIHFFGQLSALLEKGEADAAARKIDPSVFVNARLAPDMLPLSRQVQIASDAAKGLGARLAGVENPSFPDTETNFAELKDRIGKTVAFLKGLKEDQINGKEDTTVLVKTGGQEREFKASDYAFNFAIPNFFFHVTAAYAILRHNGVEIGKQDFLGLTN